jgi:cytochrome b6-f complex iron-sulfur subunit
MDSTTVLVVAIPVLVVLALATVFLTASRRDRASAMGVLGRETRRRDRSEASAEALPDTGGPPLSGKEVERAAVAARRRAVVVAPTAAPPARAEPLDAEALGVTRRQFLNRGILNMFGVGVGAFGAAVLAYLYPKVGGGFGAKLSLPDKLDDILSYYEKEKKPYYYAPGRTYLVPYPKGALPKAKKVQSYQSVIQGMEAGVVALYQKCVHLGCRVPWCATSQWFECPCHGSQYNRVGEKKGGPAPRGLDRFSIDVKGGKVTVDTGIVVQGPPIGTNTTGQEAEGPHCVGGKG